MSTISSFFTNSSRQQDSQSRKEATKAQRTAEAKAAFTASLTSAGSHLNAKFQSRAKDIHENSAALVKQEEDLGRDTATLEKQNDEMQKFLETTQKQLEDLDDAEFSHVEDDLDADLALIEETLRLVEEDDYSGEDETLEVPNEILDEESTETLHTDSSNDKNSSSTIPANEDNRPS